MFAVPENKDDDVYLDFIHDRDMDEVAQEVLGMLDHCRLLLDQLCCTE